VNARSCTRSCVSAYAAALSGFLVYFLGNVTQALGQSGILPTPLAAIAPAAAATLLGMTLLFHEEDG